MALLCTNIVKDALQKYALRLNMTQDMYFKIEKTIVCKSSQPTESAWLTQSVLVLDTFTKALGFTHKQNRTGTAIHRANINR